MKNENSGGAMGLAVASYGCALMVILAVIHAQASMTSSI